MLAADLKWHLQVRQIRGANPGVLNQVLEDGCFLRGLASARAGSGFGLVHRSPQPRRDERRLLLTLDWLA